MQHVCVEAFELNLLDDVARPDDSIFGLSVDGGRVTSLFRSLIIAFHLSTPAGIVHPVWVVD